MPKKTVRFTDRSVVQSVTEIRNFIPPNSGWNYVEVIDHPLDSTYSHEYTGKWLLFIPDADFIGVFRHVAELTAEMRLTSTFKALGQDEGEKGEHVFCIYCNSSDIPFVRSVAETLNREGFIEKYGFRYRNGTKAIFFKTDEATHYESRSLGKSLTLFRYTTNKELSLKEFHNGNPEWRFLTENEADPNIIEDFRFYLQDLTFSRDNF